MQHNQLNRKEKEDHGKDNPALNKVIERNIRTIIHLRTKAATPTPSPPFRDG